MFDEVVLGGVGGWVEGVEDVGRDAFLYGDAVGVAHPDAGEAHYPAVGQFVTHWHAASSAAHAAEQEDVGHIAHGVDERVGGGIGVSVLEHDGGSEPFVAHVRGADVERFGVGVVVVSRAALVLPVANEGVVVDEGGGEAVGVVQ